jgi:hypothetical protein
MILTLAEAKARSPIIDALDATRVQDYLNMADQRLREFCCRIFEQGQATELLSTQRGNVYPQNTPILDPRTNPTWGTPPTTTVLTLVDLWTGNTLTRDTVDGDGSGDYYLDPNVNHVDGKSGHFIITYGAYTRLQVTYVGGYATIPEALKGLVLRAALIENTLRGFNGLQNQSNVGLSENLAADPWGEWEAAAQHWRNYA